MFFDFRPRDLLWLLVSPIYLLLGTLRHEGSHALAGVATGIPIEEFVFWPSAGHWGYVRFGGPVTWIVVAAPYVVDVVLFAICAVWLARMARECRVLRINVFIVGLLSPAVDATYNYVKAFHGGGDVAAIFQVVPWYLVHLVFVGFAVVSILLMVRALRRSGTAA